MSFFREQHSSSPSARPYTSFSVKLSGIVHELHRCLLQALIAETSSTTKTQILKVYPKCTFALQTGLVQSMELLTFASLFSRPEKSIENKDQIWKKWQNS